MPDLPVYPSFFRRIRSSSWLVFLVQAVLACGLFWQTWLPSDALVFSDLGDGTKNQYTLQTYLRDQPDDWFGYEAMNHPFGESLWYTDATPVIAIGLRIFAAIGVPSPWLATNGFNLFLLLGIALSSVFLFKIFDRTSVQLEIAWLLCIALPWISPQLLRLSVGHFNLSLGWIILGAWWWIIKWEEESGKKRWWWMALLMGWMVLASGHHLYYLPMLAFITGIWMLISGWQHRQNTQKLAERLGLALAVPALAGIQVIGWIRWTDPFFNSRPEEAQGYNWGGWNLNVDSLLQAYDHLPIPGIPGLRGFMNIETHVYLGGFVIWTLLVSLIWVLASKWIKKFPPMHPGSRPIWVTPLLLSGWLCLVIAVGEYLRSFGANLNFDNWLHPFKLLKLISEDITQFRCLGRFAWPVYWAGAIGGGMLWDRMWKGSWGIPKLAFLLLFIPLITDSIGQIQYVKDNLKPNPLNLSTDIGTLDPELIAGAQGILPLPFYHVGTEVLDLTIDPVTEWEQLCLQTAISLDLPLISCKMSRTPPVQAQSVMDWLNGATAPKELGDKPVLVMFSLNPEFWRLPPEPDRVTATTAFEAGKSLPTSWSLEEVARSTDIVWYLWRK